MLAEDILIRIYARRQQRALGDKAPAITQEEYVDLLRHFGPGLAQKYRGISVDDTDIVPGLRLPHEVTAWISFAISKFVDLRREINVDKPMAYFRRMIHNEIAEFFRDKKQETWSKRIYEELNKENEHVFLFEKSKASLLQDWWGALRWKTEGIEQSVKKYSRLHISDTDAPSPYWEVLQEKLEDGEIIRQYSLYLLNLVNAYLQFFMVRDALEHEFLNLEVVLESGLKNDGDDEKQSEPDWWQRSPIVEDLDPLVVAEDLQNIALDLHDRFILYGRARGLKGPKIAEESSLFATSDWGKERKFTKFEKSVEGNCWKKMKPRLAELGYCTPAAFDLIAQLLHKEFPNLGLKLAQRARGGRRNGRSTPKLRLE
jgi:hypothetical protein